uniref:Clathrin interactor 1 n=4 Tax=Culex pipiens TaxID=7175 RepID=A0A8D8JDZ5_CULPI
MDKFISMWKVRELADKVTNVVMNYTEIEGKVREATNDEAWGPTGPLMQELAHATFTYEHFPEVMSMLWKRMLQDNKTNWRRTYKSLLLLNYLVRNGSERVVTSSREHIYDLRSLENYTFVDENGKDQGINVRHKVRELIDFIQDDDKLREERKKAKKNKDKYIGMSSEAMGGGMRYGGSGGGGGGEYGGYRDSGYDGRRSEDRGYNEGRDRYEYDYQYDGEREDSDTESNGPSSNRYYDKERSKSPATRQSSSVSAHSHASGSTLGSGEKKINLNIKAPTTVSAVTKQPVGGSKATKKIDMGAASSFGKSTGTVTSSNVPTADLGINSPTHRNTHAEEILVTHDTNATTADDLFKTCPGPPSVGSPGKLEELDDFNPRAADVPAAAAAPEFGDFESAFGAPPASKPAAGDDFADFAAFGSAAVPTPVAPSTDLFFGMSPSSGSSSANLFGGMAQPTAAVPAANDLLSDLSGLSLGSTNAGAELRRCTQDLLRVLQETPRIRSGEELDAIRRGLDGLLECLPGPRTPEQLFRVDREDGGAVDWDRFAAEDYPGLLEELVARFDGEFPGMPVPDGRVWRLFCVDRNRGFVVENLRVLTDATLLERNREVFALMLSRLVQDDDWLGGTIVDATLVERGSEIDGLAKHNAQVSSDQLVQFLVAIPNRVANVLQRDTPDVFLPERFSQILLQHCLKAIDGVARATEIHQNLTTDPTFLSKLLSKIVTDFNSNKQSTHLQTSLRILSIWAHTNSHKPLLQAIFTNLSRPAIETIAVITLNKGIDLHDLLPEALTGDWRYVLTQKIPLFSTFPNPDPVVENLLHLLARKTSNLLHDLIQELITVWSSRTAIQRTPFEQHLYASKLLLLAMAYQAEIGKPSAEQVREFRRLLFGGLKCHLESPVKQMRCVGMIVAEVILGRFDEGDVPAENRLRFEFEGFDGKTLTMVEELRSFGGRCRFAGDELSQGLIEGGEVLDELVEKLFASSSERGEVVAFKPVETPVIAEVEVVDMKLPDSKKITHKEQRDSDDSELDSDDDLEPYDLSNDTKIDQDRLRPRYLLDLREVLLDNSDQQTPQRFEIAIQAAPDLIDQQMANNDLKLALDLLQIFLSLESRCYMEDFEQLKFTCLVRIGTTFPKQCAEYLCREFHSDISKYSLQRRVLMLDILAQMAKVLANLDKTDKPPTPTSPTQPQKPPTNLLESKFREEAEQARKRALAERIVRDRIQSKTRRFSSRPLNATQPPETINRFSPVAGHFFYPLLRGFGSKQFLFSANLSFQYDADQLLLTTFLQTLAVLMICAENCTDGRRFARELVQLSVMLRFSEEPKVRASVLQMLAAVLMAVSREVLRQDLYAELMELRGWLEECTRESVVARAEQNEECRELARHVLVMCYGVLAEQ